MGLWPHQELLMYPKLVASTKGTHNLYVTIDATNQFVTIQGYEYKGGAMLGYIFRDCCYAG